MVFKSLLAKAQGDHPEENLKKTKLPTILTRK